MRVPRLVAPALGAGLGVAGAATSVVVARLDEPGRVPVDQLAVALALLAYAIAAVLVSVARPGHPVGWLLALGVAGWGSGEGLLALGLGRSAALATGADAWAVTSGTALRGAGWLVLVLAVPLVFPDGRVPWPGRRLPGTVCTVAIGLFTAALLLAPVPLDRRAASVQSPTGLPASLTWLADLLALVGLAACAVALLVAVAGLVHRWRSGDALRHQQLAWLGAAFALPIAFMPLVATTVARPWMFALVTLPVPVAISVAVLQRRLYDLHLAVSRSLTYLALSAAVALLYAATVAGVGALLDERGARWLPWLAAGVVAVSFAPLRNALQQGVSRLTYGQWDEPAEVLAATSRRLVDAADVPGLLQSLAEGLGRTLRLDRVEISDRDGRLLAVHGADGAVLDGQELTAFGSPVGALRWASARPLREADRRLLADVAGQLGGVVHTAALVERLRVAQQRLVVAGEEERRRLRRDLHDGLGPELASLTLRVDELRNRWPSLDDPDPLLLELRAATQAATVGVRRIVEGLAPAPLDELGLPMALEQAALRHAGDLVVDVDVRPLPALPAAVEVAVLGVVQEALANVRQHASAHQVSVRLRAESGRLLAEVRDDGVGTVVPRPGGVGLQSMAERAEELGGRLTIDGRPGRGTVVSLDLPIVVGHRPSAVTA